jgi:hypothetical protein
MSNIDKLQRYRHLYEHCMNKLDSLLQKELSDYNQFLEECNISVLPDNHYKDGKPLNYGEIAKLRTEWENRRKNLKT